MKYNGILLGIAKTAMSAATPARATITKKTSMTMTTIQDILLPADAAPADAASDCCTSVGGFCPNIRTLCRLILASSPKPKPSRLCMTRIFNS